MNMEPPHNDSIEIFQLRTFGILDRAVSGTRSISFIDLFLQFFVRIQVATEEVKDGAQPDSRGVGASNNISSS